MSSPGKWIPVTRNFRLDCDVVEVVLISALCALSSFDETLSPFDEITGTDCALLFEELLGSRIGSGSATAAAVPKIEYITGVRRMNRKNTQQAYCFPLNRFHSEALHQRRFRESLDSMHSPHRSFDHCCRSKSFLEPAQLNRLVPNRPQDLVIEFLLALLVLLHRRQASAKRRKGEIKQPKTGRE